MLYEVEVPGPPVVLQLYGKEAGNINTVYLQYFIKWRKKYATLISVPSLMVNSLKVCSTYTKDMIWTIVATFF